MAPSNSTPSSSSTPDPTSSYTAMSTGDVEAIGAHCQMEYCRQLDFLPFRCESCRKTFCLDHRSEMAHKCEKEGLWARQRAQRLNGGMSTSRTTSSKPNILTHEAQCPHPSCKTLIDTPLTPGVHCQTCNRRYCLKHRMKEDHDCAKLVPLGARPNGSGSSLTISQQKEKGKAALDKLRAWGMGKTSALSATVTSTVTTKKKAAERNQVANINSLKLAAKGDGKVPIEKRVYLFVEASADTTKAKFPTGKFFYSADWTVGRVLDAAAKALQVENLNNRGGGEAERLRVFHVEAGRLLEFSEKLGVVTSTGNTIVLLRGVGPPVPDLIEM
jgi:hypothetical protein